MSNNDLSDKADVSQIIKYATYTMAEQSENIQPDSGISLGAISSLFDLPSGAIILGVLSKANSGHGGIIFSASTSIYAFNARNSADYILAGSTFACLYI